MDVLVMLEEAPEHPQVLAQVNSVPAAVTGTLPSREVVTLYGVPTAESLALALAAAFESRRSGEAPVDTVRHLGVWPGRGAVGDAAWRDGATGRLVTHDLEIPEDALRGTATTLMTECGSTLRRVVGGLVMADWPEGTRRAVSFRLEPAFAALPFGGADDLLALQREGASAGWAWDWEESEHES